MPVGPSVTKYYWLKTGDIISHENAESFSYTPFIADPETRIAIMQANIDTLTAQTTQNKNDILDIKAAITNLQPDIQNTVTVIDMTNAVDITSNGTFNVTSTLGGRINGEGYTLLGLLGLKVAATGYVEVNGDRIYDNTALLGGSVPPLVADVQDGDVITTSGMSTLVFTPYIAKVPTS